MKKLSTGDDSTLGNWLSLSVAVFGSESKATEFLKKKIEESDEGEDEEVIAEETQVLMLLGHLHTGEREYTGQKELNKLRG